MNRFIKIIKIVIVCILFIFGCSGPEPPEELEWQQVDAGSFVFGSPEDTPFRGAYREEEVNVTLTHDFVMATTEITQYQWLQVEDKMPDQLSYGDNLPVTMVNFYDAVKFCNDLSIKEGYAPCYDLSSCKGEFAASCPYIETDEAFQWCDCQNFLDIRDSDCTDVTAIYNCEDENIHRSDNWYECEGYRLPTTAEWEYAAKAGTTTHTYGGDVHGDPKNLCVDEESLNDIAWYCFNSDEKLHNVGQKEPNPWGFYDILGNVEEIVDYFTDGDSLDYMDGHWGEDLIDPQGRNTGYSKDYRGGSIEDIGELTRSSWQMAFYPSTKQSIIGFRPVRTLLKK